MTLIVLKMKRQKRENRTWIEGEGCSESTDALQKVRWKTKVIKKGNGETEDGRRMIYCLKWSSLKNSNTNRCEKCLLMYAG